MKRRKKMFRVSQGFLKMLFLNLIAYRGSAALERMVLPLQVSGRLSIERVNARKQNRTFIAFLLRIG